jgi:hypothetical protein
MADLVVSSPFDGDQKETTNRLADDDGHSVGGSGSGDEIWGASNRIVPVRVDQWWLVLSDVSSW